MANAKLHWFWRGTIAVVVSLLFLYIIANDLTPITPLYWHAVQYLWSKLPFLIRGKNITLIMIVWYEGLPAILVAVTTYGLLARWLGGSPIDGELHC